MPVLNTEHRTTIRKARKADLPIRGLSHASIRVQDIEATRRFYEDVLGLRLTWTLVNRMDVGGQMCDFIYAWFELGSGYLGFFEIFDAKTEPHKPSREHVEMHFAMEISSLAALHDMEKRLQSEGQDCSVSNRGWCTSLYFNDPDGWALEFTFHHEDADETLDQAQAARDSFAKYIAKSRSADRAAR